MDKVWRRVFARKFSEIARYRDDETAKAIAAGLAWNRVKAMGAITLIGTIGPRQVPLLNRTGRLQESLVPNSLDSRGVYEPYNEDQIFRLNEGNLEIGTKVEYAEAVSQKRPIWPRRMGPWMDRALGAGRDAFFRHLQLVIRSRSY